MSENQINSACSLNLIDHLKTILFSEEFRNRHRRSANDFTRNRCLTFVTLVFF